MVITTFTSRVLWHASYYSKYQTVLVYKLKNINIQLTLRIPLIPGTNHFVFPKGS